MDRLQKGDHGAESDFDSEIPEAWDGPRSDRFELPEDILHSKDALVVVLDASGSIISLNREFIRRSGASLEEVRGTVFAHRFLALKDRSAFHALLHTATLNLTPQRFSADFLLKNNIPRKVQGFLVSLVGKDWAVEHLVLVAFEVSPGGEE